MSDNPLSPSVPLNLNPPKVRSNWRSWAGPEHDASKVTFRTGKVRDGTAHSQAEDEEQRKDKKRHARTAEARREARRKACELLQGPGMALSVRCFHTQTQEGERVPMLEIQAPCQEVLQHERPRFWFEQPVSSSSAPMSSPAHRARDASAGFGCIGEERALWIRMQRLEEQLQTDMQAMEGLMEGLKLAVVAAQQKKGLGRTQTTF
jgi:hypothetical protein